MEIMAREKCGCTDRKKKPSAMLPKPGHYRAEHLIKKYSNFILITTLLQSSNAASLSE
jgi:hypothetical protein